MEERAVSDVVLKYTDVMLDMETLGTAPGSAIISIGAVAFSEEMGSTGWKTYYSEPISRASCASIGLVADTATLQWWAQQNEEARKTFDDSEDVSRSTHIIIALQKFARWYPQGARLWSNGANFDGVLLREAYRRAMLKAPYQYYEEHCYRTMKSLWREVPKPEFNGTRHSALDDALYQTHHLLAIFTRIKELRTANNGKED